MVWEKKKCEHKKKRKGLTQSPSAFDQNYQVKKKNALEKEWSFEIELLNRCTELFFCVVSLLWPSWLFRKSTKRVLELEIQLENNRVASPVSSSGAESQSDTKDVAALKIRIKSLEREVQQKKLEVEKMEHRLTEQSKDKLLELCVAH